MKKRIIYFLSFIIIGLSVALMTSCEDDELFSIKEVLITWENPVDVIDGVALSETELNATANVPGTMVFTPALGTVLPKGDHTLTADFTPRESKYPGLSKTVTVTVVDKLIPVITWEDPAVLALGTPLSEEQLNATADVEGTFVYTPPIGTVLPLGDNQELKVDFTPSVITHQPTSKTVMINVRDVVPLKFVQNSAVYTGEQSFAFTVDGEVGSLGDNPETGFTVHVTNTAKLVDRDVEVTGVSINAEDATKLELTLASEIYADDVITVAFITEGSGIISTDDQPLLSFDAQKVTIPVAGENLLADKLAWAGFEATAAPNTGGVAGYWVGALPHPWARNTDMYVSGEASMKFSGGFDDKPLYGMNFGVQINTEPGAFEVSHKIYIEEGSNLKMIHTTIARKVNGWDTDTEAFWDVENIPRGRGPHQ